MKSYFKLIVFVIILWIYCLGYVQGQITTDPDIRISIITCAPGNDLYSIYGHNAIRISNGHLGTDIVYNYGTFDFNTPGFAIKFMRGKLLYRLTAAHYYDFLREYEYTRRNVTEQVLYLDPLQQKKIINYVANNMKPENATYKYDFFMDNCATRLRDILDKNVSNFVWDQSGASGKTFRQIIKEYQVNMPWTDFGIDLIIGAPADKMTTLSQEAFIPDYLATAISKARYKDSAKIGLVFRKYDLVKLDHSTPSPHFLLSPWFLFMILIILEINIFFRFLNGKISTWVSWYDKCWFFILFISSILMIFMWFGTDHIPTKYNWNLLWANPLILFYWWSQKSKNNIIRWLWYVSMLLLSISFLNAIPGIQFLPQYFHPLVLIITVILGLKLWRSQHKSLLSHAWT
ncbi:MAG: DUF4105 domain-containing protein [Saprospiraceae bacterium]